MRDQSLIIADYKERLRGWEFIGCIIDIAKIDENMTKQDIPDHILNIIQLKYDNISLTSSYCDLTLDTHHIKIIIYILYRPKEEIPPLSIIYVRLPPLKNWLKSINKEDYKVPIPHEIIFY